MSLIGIDLGTHSCSLALYTDASKAVPQVIADDMGTRAIPSIVAFRGSDILSGQAASAQQSKNPSNTFDNVIEMLLYSDTEKVHVPALDKEISVIELASHLFQNLFNQVKKQVGSDVNNSVVLVNKELSPSAMQNLKDAAELGGLLIKSVLLNTTAPLVAYQLDHGVMAHPLKKGARVFIVDVGYSQSTASVFDITSGGLYHEVITKQTEVCTAKALVELLTNFCVKDFKRKTKMDITEDKRAMLRLNKECQSLMKMLSTSSEANLTIDALYEGMDYTAKISRAKFEDVCGMPFMKFRNFLNTEILSTLSEPITHVCIVGGLSNIPKVQSIVSSLVPENVEYPKLLNVDTSEVHCLGAAFQGGYLSQQSLLDNGFDFAKNTTEIPVTTAPVYLTTGSEKDFETIFSKLSTNEVPTDAIMLLPKGATFNTVYTFPVVLSDSVATSFVLMTNTTKLCEIVCPVADSKDSVLKIFLKDTKMIVSVVVKGESVTELEVPLV